MVILVNNSETCNPGYGAFHVLLGIINKYTAGTNLFACTGICNIYVTTITEGSIPLALSINCIRDDSETYSCRKLTVIPVLVKGKHQRTLLNMHSGKHETFTWKEFSRVSLLTKTCKFIILQTCLAPLGLLYHVSNICKNFLLRKVQYRKTAQFDGYV